MRDDLAVEAAPASKLLVDAAVLVSVLESVPLGATPTRLVQLTGSGVLRGSTNVAGSESPVHTPLKQELAFVLARWMFAESAQKASPPEFASRQMSTHAAFTSV